jgi:uncharacterized membrane protein HdeD (DUF308 family)
MESMNGFVKTVSQDWWLFLLQGVLALIFGIIALVWPGPTLAVMIGLFGFFVLLSGIVGVFAAIGAAGTHQSWGWKLASALVGIVAGLAILRWPGETAVIVLYLVGAWAIVTGVIGIVGAFAEHEMIPHAWLLVLSGIVSVLFGAVMFIWPVVGLTTLIYLVGIYAIVHGILNCVLAFRVRSLPQEFGRLVGTPPDALPAT